MVLNEVNVSVSSCQPFSSSGNSLNVFGWTSGMWYDSSEFSSTTFQLQGKSFSQVAACRYAPPYPADHRSHSGPTHSRSDTPVSLRLTNTNSPQAPTRNGRRHELSRSHGRNARASGILPVCPSRLNSHPW